jgi:uncharacterized protein YhdP
MKKALQLIGLSAVTLLLFFLVVLLAFYHLIQIGELRRFLISEIENQTGLKVQLGEADLELGWISGISFRDVALSLPQSAQAVMTAQRITARVALLPLLERKVVFYELRLAKPAARLQRDESGKILLFDQLLNIPFLKDERGAISVDLLAIGIENGEIDFHDQLGTAAATTHFRAIDLKLEPIRGQALRDFIGSFVKSGRNRPQGAALDFSLISDVERDGQKTTLQAKGKMIFPAHRLEFGNAWWDASLQLTGVPAAVVQQYAGSRMPIKSLSGSLSPRLRIEGNAERLRIKGEMGFTELAIDAPDIFVAALTPGDGTLNFDIDSTPERLEIMQVALRSKEIWLSLRGDIGRGNADRDKETHLRLELSAPALPVAIVKKYLPLKFPALAQWESYAGALEEGEIQIHKAGVNARLAALGRMPQAGLNEGIWIDAELRNLRVNLSSSAYLPIRGLYGRVSLANGILALKDIQGEYGHSRFSTLGARYHLAPAGEGNLELHARGDLDLSEVQEQFHSGLLKGWTKLASSVSEMGGQGKIDLALRRLAESPLQFEGRVLLDNARFRFDNLSLTEVRGELALTPQEIKSQKLRSVISGSPAEIQLTLKDYGADNGSFDLSIESAAMKPSVLTQMFLGSGSVHDTGIVRGSVRYNGPLANRRGRKFTGNLELANVQLSAQPLLQPLRELNGKIRIDETGIDFQNLSGLLAGFPASVSGRWRYEQKPQLLFDFASPNLDISYLISQVNPESSAFYANLHAVGRVDIGHGKFKTFEFSELNSDLVVDRRVWRLTHLSTRSAGGTVQGSATITYKPDTLAGAVESKIQGVPIQGFLNWLETQTTEMTGQVNLTGNFESVGQNASERRRNLNGAFSVQIDGGTIHRLRILVQILNLLDLSRWFTLQVPDLAKQGIRFRSITGDFKVTKGVFSTHNLLVDSDDLRMTGAGKIDLPNEQIDFVLAVRPFAGMDSAINYIPVIGRGIAAIKNSFLVASFNVKGPIDDPVITPAPLSTISEVFFGVLGLPKRLIPVGGDDKKSEAHEASEPLGENVPVP